MASQLVVRACPPFRVPGWESSPAAAELERDALIFLDQPELERARAMMPRPRQDFLASRIAQRRFAAELLHVRAQDLSARYACPRCGSRPDITHGRPGYILAGAPAPLLLSLSRSAGWTLLAAVTEPGPDQRLGVDVEDPQRLDFDGFDSVALTPGERDALASLRGDGLLRGRARMWARKEAVLKMTGEGLSRSPETLDVVDRPDVRDLAAAATGLPGSLVGAVALG
jgi:4'-phosphopantetheinyl transferase